MHEKGGDYHWGRGGRRHLFVLPNSVCPLPLLLILFTSIVRNGVFVRGVEGQAETILDRGGERSVELWAEYRFRLREGCGRRERW